MATIRDLLDRFKTSNTTEREQLAAAARRHAPADNPLGLTYTRDDRVRDLDSGLVGVIVTAGRDGQTGWELYRVKLADQREVFRTDRQLTRAIVLALVVLALVWAAPLEAQTPAPATITSVQVLILPATGDPVTVTPIATRATPISATSTACNLAPTPGPPPASLTNPALAEVPDPFHAGRACVVPIPSGLPDGTGYRSASVFVADTCSPVGVPPMTPCPSPRSVLGAPPFSIVSPVLVPSAPASLRLLP